MGALRKSQTVTTPRQAINGLGQAMPKAPSLLFDIEVR